MIITKDCMISYVGPKLDNDKLLCHLDYLSVQSHAVYDEIKNFKLVHSNVDNKQKFALMDYFKYIEQVYEEPMSKAVSWRLDFLERTSYSVKGDAQRSFACEIFLITID